MKVIYIAGPYRGKDAWEVERNIRMAEVTEFAVASMGFVPLCPHTMYRYFDGTLSDEFWLEATQELLRRCDGIVMSIGWEHSSGSKAELELARELGINIWMSFQEFRDWAEAQKEEA